MLKKTSSETEDEFSTFLGHMAVAAVMAVAVVGGFYFWHFRKQPISGDPAVWGQLGDFFGGTINPLFAMFSLLVLMFSLQVQRSTLREARQQGVLEEIQRLLSSTAESLDTALTRTVGERTALFELVKPNQLLELVRPTEMAPTVADVIASVHYRLEAGAFPYEDGLKLIWSAHMKEVFRGLLRLDEGLGEFTFRGGDRVIGKLYGSRYREPARVLLALNDLEAFEPGTFSYPRQALARLDLHASPDDFGAARALYVTSKRTYDQD